MIALSPHWRRTLSLALLAGAMAVPLAGCQNKTETTTKEDPKKEQEAGFGPCLPSYGSNVRSAAMSADGSRMIYITDDAPANLSKAQSEAWRSADRALMIREVDANGLATRRFIALSWDTLPDGTIRTFPTPGGDDSADIEQVELSETMSDVQLSADGQRFVLGIKRPGVIGKFAKLYTGVVPEVSAITDEKTGETRPMSPEKDLELIPINSFGDTEGIQSYTVSADGNKVAAVVGAQGAVRVYDIQAKKLTAYLSDKAGKVTTSDKLPPVQINLTTVNNEAIVSQGGMRVTWDPKGTQLAVSRSDGVSGSAVWLLDVATGKLVLVRRFQNSTLPHVAWSKDGQSLFVMNTPIVSGTVFGDSEIRRIQAKEKGADIGKGAGLKRVQGMKSEPIALTSFGDDIHFLIIWDGVLYRLDMPGGDPAKATYVALTSRQDDLEVLPASLGTSETKQLAMFMAEDTNSQDNSIGVREEAFNDTCSTTIVATSEPSDQPTPTPEKK